MFPVYILTNTCSFFLFLDLCHTRTNMYARTHIHTLFPQGPLCLRHFMLFFKALVQMQDSDWGDSATPGLHKPCCSC